MAWGILTGTANGRGFDSAGLLGRIAASVVLGVASHGQTWHLIDDQSSLPTDPYIVIASKPQPWVHVDWPKILRISLPTATAGFVLLESLYYYNTTTKGFARWHFGSVRTLDASYFPFWLRGGETGLFVHTWPGGESVPTWYGISDLISNDNEYENQTHSGTSIDSAFEVTGDPSGIISGWFDLVGLNEQTTDVDGNVYLSIINTTGSTYRLDLFRDAARTQRVASTATFNGTTTGVRVFNADTTYSPGVTGTLSNTVSLSPNTSISCRTRSLILQTGEGANITPGRFYFLLQLTHLTSVRVSFSRVVAKYGDRIVFDSVRSGMAFGAGTFVSPQPLRHYAWGNISYGFSTYYTILGLALLGKQGQERPTSFSNSFGRPSNYVSFPTGPIQRISPDLYGRFRVSHGIVYENIDSAGNSAGLSSIWGGLRNMGFCSATGITIMSNGRDEAGVDYLAGHSYDSGFLAFRDTETSEID